MSYQNVHVLSLAVDPALATDIAPGQLIAINSVGATKAAAATDLIVGIALEGWSAADFGNGAENGVIPVGVEGIVEVQAGAAIAVGAQVTSDANADAVAGAAGNNAIGIALTAAAQAGDYITVLLQNDTVA